MAIINKTGIGNGNLIEAEHITRIIDSLNGTGSYDIAATGSFTGSFTGTFNGSIVSASFATTASHVTGTVSSASFASTASYVLNAVSSSFSSTASYVQNAIVQNGNSFGASMIIGTDDAYDLRLQVSGSTALIIEGSTAAYKRQVLVSTTGSKDYPALAIGGTTTGIYVGDGGDAGSGTAVGIIDSGEEAASFQQTPGGSGYPVAIIGNREYFRSGDKWGNPGLHLQAGSVYADGFNSNVFYSSGASGWIKKSTNCGYWVDPSSTNLDLYTAPTSSNTGSAYPDIAPPAIFMQVDPNYVSGGSNQPNVKISNRLKIGILWAGTATGIGWDSSTGEVRYASSDQRLKTNIQTVTSSLNIVNSLRGVSFNWTNENEPEFKIGTDSTGSQIGLIAQEVQQVLPNVVKPNGFKDYLTVEYDKIVAVLIEAVKEQQQQIDALKTRLDTLENSL